MKDLRNPINRTSEFQHPAGNAMQEIKGSDLNNFAAGAGETKASSGVVCTATAECNLGTIAFLCC